MEVRGYIDRRLEVAGAPNRLLQVFPAPTLARILHYAHGIPRLVNTLCDSALVSAYGKGLKSVPPAMIDEVAGDLRLSLKNSVQQMTGTPFNNRPGEDEASRKTLVKTLMRLARLLDPGADNDKNQGVAG
jgi:hypothetical protein